MDLNLYLMLETNDYFRNILSSKSVMNRKNKSSNIYTLWRVILIYFHCNLNHAEWHNIFFRDVKEPFVVTILVYSYAILVMVNLCLIPLYVLHRLILMTSNTIVRACLLVSALTRKSADIAMQCYINANGII